MPLPSPRRRPVGVVVTAVASARPRPHPSSPLRLPPQIQQVGRRCASRPPHPGARSGGGSPDGGGATGWSRAILPRRLHQIRSPRPRRQPRREGADVRGPVHHIWARAVKEVS
uniref:Uncharacterized protein n=1 Tax=Arundo donax TaxID=35708 RepID=A0A0A9D8N1_ARUDO